MNLFGNADELSQAGQLAPVDFAELVRQIEGARDQLVQQLYALVPTPDARLEQLAADAKERAREPRERFLEISEATSHPGDTPYAGPGLANARVKQRAAKIAPAHRNAWVSERDAIKARLAVAESLERKWSVADPQLEALEKAAMTLRALVPWDTQVWLALSRVREARREAHAVPVRLRRELREAEWNVATEAKDLQVLGRQAHVYPVASADLKVPPRYQPRLSRPGGGRQ